MNEVAPYLRNRRSGIVVRYNPITATHPDMVLCDELPWKKEAATKPVKPTNRRNAVKPKAEPKAEPAGDAEIDDLLAGIDHG